tara:strand:+ start:1149 stop:2675 length:1527 start_codon:yes stop_codon:yes gene_type:complete
MSTTKVTDNLRNTTQVDAAKITTGTIPEARINSLDATKLTGTVADARFPSTLPAMSGENLTALPAGNLTGTIDNARISLDAAEIPSLDTAKVTSGTFADARISSSSVTQHVTATDTSSIENDILNLAINQAVLNDRVAFNLDNSFIDGFEDDTGITTETNVDRDTTGEYVSSVITIGGAIDSNTLLLVQSDTTDGSTTITDTSSNGRTVTINGNTQHDTAQKKFAASSILFDGTGDYLELADNSDWNLNGHGASTVDFWIRTSGSSFGVLSHNTGDPVNNWDLYLNGSGQLQSLAYSASGGNGAVNVRSNTALNNSAWHHCVYSWDGSTVKIGIDGSWENSQNETAPFQDIATTLKIGKAVSPGSNTFNGHMEEIRISSVARWSHGSSYSVPTTMLNQKTVNATGTLISDPQTASSSRTSCSGVIIYEDYAGTNTIGTDLKIYFTANNGSNWTEAASYATAVTYSGSKKLVKLGATTVTSGTQVAMKAVWANQSASKEARLHGWAVSY